MSVVLTETNRGSAFTAVGSPEGLAQNFWDHWGPRDTASVVGTCDSQVITWVHEYLNGVRASVSNLLNRELTVVTGADALAGFLASYQPDQSRPAALANLARIVFNISREVGASHVSPWSAPVVELEASRLRFPALKRTREARATRTLSSSGELPEQLARLAHQLPAGCQVVIVDDRLQSGGTLRTISSTASKHGLQPRAVLVAHSELPRSETQSLLPGVYVYAHCYDYESSEERNDWIARHQRGEVRMPLSEELHDIIAASPAAGEAVVYKYMEALPQLKSIHLHLKTAFKELVNECPDILPVDYEEVKTKIDLTTLRTLGVDIRDEERLFSYVSKRVLEHRMCLANLRAPDAYDTRRLETAEINARWGADDVDLLFSHTRGCLTLRECPEFNTDCSDRRRFGSFFPFSDRATLTIQKDLRAQGPLHWATYSLHELDRTIELVDKWRSAYGEPAAESIPHLSMPTIRRVMAHKQKTSALDQLAYLRSLLADQIRANAVSPLVV